MEVTKYGQVFYRAEADSAHPEGCKCFDRSGDCNWCRIYYDGPTEMTCEEFYESHAYRRVEAYMDEMYWDGGVNTEALFEALLDEAKREGVTLTDADTWNYDRYLYNAYRCTEKGLS